MSSEILAFKHGKAISNWLFFTAFFVFVMIVIGAITRLTESGLSMVEWRPLIGALPPIGHEEWQHVFGLYKQSPEFQKKNFWMELDDFQRIFFWEWFHRLWGRLIGLVYGLPFFYFLFRGQIPTGYKTPLIILLLLGAFQGALGWYMVKSGLVDQPAVSHYRLASHLSVAMLILALLCWFAMRIRCVRRTPHAALYVHGWIALGFLVLAVFWGAYVAGLDAGLLYNEYPMMGDGFMPEEIWFYEPFWVNFFENAAAVQFVHRWVAVLAALVILSFVGHALYQKQHSICFPILGILVMLQVGLGIVTLLTHVYLPVAVMHQANAALVLIALVCCLYRVSPKAMGGKKSSGSLDFGRL